MSNIVPVKITIVHLPYFSQADLPNCTMLGVDSLSDQSQPEQIFLRNLIQLQVYKYSTFAGCSETAIHIFSDQKIF
ncbi:hypothetical protein NTGBS_820052 [Candidatus Nitrotoga sp. BS]|nr:hypothetical protein NTGBS_820052 [Candidatus Nitrotoga sp. BS]